MGAALRVKVLDQLMFFSNLSFGEHIAFELERLRLFANRSTSAIVATSATCCTLRPR
jgi:hypothetical protein